MKDGANKYAALEFVVMALIISFFVGIFIKIMFL